MGLLVRLQPISCTLATKAVLNLQDTPVEVSLGLAGAVAIRWRFANLGSAVATRGYLVHDPVNQAAAIAMLLSNDSRSWFFIGDSWSKWLPFTVEAPTRSVWVKSNTNNETGSSALLFEYKVPL